MHLNVVERYKKISKPVKASLFFTVCSFVQKGIALLTTPIFTRLLTTEQYGVYTVYQSWYNIVIIFCTLDLCYGAYNTGVVKYGEDKDGFLSSLEGLSTTITVALFVVYLCFHDFWNNIFGLSTLLCCTMFTEILFVSAYQLWTTSQRFEYKYKGIVIATIIIAVANPLLGIISVISTDYKAEARIISMALVQIAVGLVLYIFIFAKGKKFFNFKYWKFAICFSIPLIPHYLSETILNQADRIMISRMVGSSEAAIYSVAYTISMMMIYVANAIKQSFVPYTYKALKNKNTEKVPSIMNMLLVLMAGLCLVVIAFGPEIIRIFASSDYYEAIYVIPPVAASVYFFFLYNEFCYVEMYFEENKFILIGSCAVAAINIGLNFGFIKLFGYLAAGYTTLFCYVLFCAIHYVLYKRTMRKRADNLSLYNDKIILLISICVILFSIFMAFIYDHIVIRYCVLLAILAVAFVFRKKIIRMFKDMRSSKE